MNVLLPVVFDFGRLASGARESQNRERERMRKRKRGQSTGRATVDLSSSLLLASWQSMLSRGAPGFRLRFDHSVVTPVALSNVHE